MNCEQGFKMPEMILPETYDDGEKRVKEQYKQRAKKVIESQLNCLSDTLDNFYFLLQPDNNSRAFISYSSKTEWY
jgi:hypothetical protein